MVFCGILIELVRLRLDMNKFYVMYYEKMEVRRRDFNSTGEEEEDFGKDPLVLGGGAWNVGKAIEAQVNRFWGLFHSK